MQFEPDGMAASRQAATGKQYQFESSRNQGTSEVSAIISVNFKTMMRHNGQELCISCI